MNEPPPIIITIRGESPLAQKLARACLRWKSDPARMAAATLDVMLTSVLAADAEVLEKIAARAEQKSLASQLLGA